MSGKDIGQAFTLGHFVTFLYRFSVIHFNYTRESPENCRNTKKVLSMLRSLEISDALIRFLSKLNRTYNGQLSFLPSKRLLNELLRNEGVELSMEIGNNIGHTKEELISALFNGPTVLSPIIETPSLMKRSINDSGMGSFTINEGPLKKVFENYCSFGEPLNIKYLKSSKFVRLLRECGLVSGLSELPASLVDRALQISTTDIDIAFKKICSTFERSPIRAQLSQAISQRLSLNSTSFQHKLFLKQS